MRTPALLAILDGFGIAEAGSNNAIACADAPFLKELLSDSIYPCRTINSSGRDVGLPEGQMGNSEVGHLNIGSGRIIDQELTRIDRAIEDGSLYANPVLTQAMDDARANDKALHLLGLLSDGGVHSSIEHLEALLRMAVGRGVTRIRVAAFMDGRDVSPTSGKAFIARIDSLCRELSATEKRPDVRIGAIIGRYFAMDRDNRWERVARAWRALVVPAEQDVTSVPIDSDLQQLMQRSYDAGITDEFIEPVSIGEDGISDGDVVIFFNFRPDRARELTRTFIDPEFSGFDRPLAPEVRFVCMTEYDAVFSERFKLSVAYPKVFPTNTLADYLAALGLRQLHIAETEKYAHVTFFFNGGIEEPKPGEQRILIPSPKVATYDLQPEMSAPGVTDALVNAINTDAADVYIVNYANCDMVGHTGVMAAAIKAVEAVDVGLKRVVDAIAAKGGVALVTADHGNAEHMIDSDGGVFTAHTLSPVPLVLIDTQAMGEKAAHLQDSQLQVTQAQESSADDLRVQGLASTYGRHIDLERDLPARLADIAPTLLDLMELPIPPEFTGRSLLKRT